MENKIVSRDHKLKGIDENKRDHIEEESSNHSPTLAKKKKKNRIGKNYSE